MSDGSPKLIAIDEETNHQVVHALCLGKADRPTYQPPDPRAQVDVLALDLLRVFLPNRVLLCLHMPLVGPQPSVKYSVMPKGSNSALSANKTVSFRRPKIYANTWPVW
jgi:hypothetical protein